MSIQEVFTKYGRDFLGEEQCVPSLEHNLGLFKEVYTIIWGNLNFFCETNLREVKRKSVQLCVSVEVVG